MPDAVLQETESIPLDTDALAYSFVDIKNARPILDKVDFMGMDDKDFQQMLDRSQSAIMAAYSPSHARRFQLAAWGSYPSSGARMAFGASKSWQKMTAPSNAAYWHSAEMGLSIALTARQAFVLAIKENDSEDAFTNPFPIEDTVVPEGFNEFRRGAVISCWINDPGQYINQKLKEAGITIAIQAEQFFVSLFPVSAKESGGRLRYEALLKIQVTSAAQARGLTSLFGIARGFLSPDFSGGSPSTLISLLFANPPIQDGNNLIFKTNALSAEETALLFAMFSL
jgi:hypothetical protein